MRTQMGRSRGSCRPRDPLSPVPRSAHAYCRQRTTAMDRAKRIKQEPPDPDDEGPRCPKQAASPAQEATRARISSLEAQLKKLCKLKSTGKLDAKGAFQIRCLEDDLRKSQSKLRRLLNEAERQRRRRERLRGAPREQQSTDDSVMATLKSCTRFQDFVRELNALGFNLTRQEEQIDDNEVMPEVDVQVELIEGDGEFPSDIKIDNTTTASSEQSSPRIVLGKDEEQDKWRQESYRQWFERQTELQQRWEEGFMREQMELARSLLESVTATFLQGVQQVLSNVTSGRRFPPFCPESPS